ncbi:hypothetical protein [Micromonospora sp. CPCC 205556]|uniref:hypothetical protein n=1 Tax=Micromonospora sp. CPCC 205556 TaxID=3122398 RepID=UPI002FF2AD55
MLLEPDAENEVAYELCQLLGRAILPIGPADAAGTAFFLEGEAGEYLLTADVLTMAEVGEIGLRASVTEPAGVAADAVVLADFPARWAHHPDVGAAAMPTAGLHTYADEHGWRWRTQPVPEAVAVRADEVAGLGAEPVSAFVLAVGVGEDGSRPLEVAVGRAVRTDDGGLRLTDALPAGYVGAPVFGVRADEAGQVGLRCLGLVLPGEGGHPLATLDRIVAEPPPAR